MNERNNPARRLPSLPWAVGLGPISPAPGNPLGTCWIGISAASVGVHSTRNGGSIGSAARHGCLRLHMGDVAELYDAIAVGRPMEILS
ncbi:MAG: hypothetical protein EXQ74_03375 [Thermoleophilia bacterium]|nr:hypothetical protein [Thermoleophilia bacterium]